MDMATVHAVNKDLLIKIVNQLSGDAKKNDELIPEHAIKGTGYIWCYEPTLKQIIRITRGIKCYILDHREDKLGRIMVYTVQNHVILIKEEELLFTGFD